MRNYFKAVVYSECPSALLDEAATYKPRVLHSRFWFFDHDDPAQVNIFARAFQWAKANGAVLSAYRKPCVHVDALRIVGYPDRDLIFEEEHYD